MTSIIVSIRENTIVEEGEISTREQEKFDIDKILTYMKILFQKETTQNDLKWERQLQQQRDRNKKLLKTQRKMTKID